MKGMYIIFPLIPLSFLWVKWFGYYSLSKLGKMLKKLKIDQFRSAAELKIFDTFFQTTVILRPIGIITWNQDQMKLKIPNFHNMKKAYWHQTAFEIFKFKNRPPPVGPTTKMDFQVSLGFLDSALTLELFLQCWIWPLHSFCGQRQPLVSFQRLNSAGHRPRDCPKKQGLHPILHSKRIEKAQSPLITFQVLGIAKNT